jgi:glycosyltransferase involved in cell wall biosynthesis
MTFPSLSEAVSAARVAELNATAATVGLPLPPIYRRTHGGVDRIVYLMPRTGPGGGARVLFEHANHLRRLGAKVTVVSYFPRPHWFELEAEFIEVAFGRPLALSIPPCDVIVAGYWDEVLSARRLGIAPVVHFEQGDFHLYDDVPEDLRPFIAASLQAADWTITVGPAAESALLERYGVIAHRIPNAVDESTFHPEPRPGGDRTVIFVGWDGTAFKGIDVARRVAEGLASSHADVKTVWVTPSSPVGEPFGETLVAPSQARLGHEMRAASVYVGTSRYESFPLPPLEAMASGTPVVSTANDGLLGYAHDGENCLLVPVDDGEALLQATRRVLDDRALADLLAAAGLRTAHAFSWPTILGELLSNFRLLRERFPDSNLDAEEVRIADLRFVDERDRSRLHQLVDASPYEQFAIPISRPIYKDYRLVRWSVVARKPGGETGLGRAYLPARSEERIEDSTYQFGVDLLREGLAADAFTWFVGQCQQAPGAAEACLGRWILLSLIEAGRPSDAMDLATLLLSAYSSHPDYYLLAALAAKQAERPIDVAAAMAAISALDAGAHFDEWFDRPGSLLAQVAVG